MAGMSCRNRTFRQWIGCSYRICRSRCSNIANNVINCSRAIRNLHFPFDCCLCREPHSDGSLCKACSLLLQENRQQTPQQDQSQHLSYYRFSCQRCALPESICGPLTQIAESDLVVHVCSACAGGPVLAYRSVTVPLSYSFPVDYMISQFKYAGDMTFARVLGERLGSVLNRQIAQLEQPPQSIIPVPLALKRLQERGFNQSFELSRVVSRICGLPVRADVLARHELLFDTALPDQRVRSRAVRRRSNRHGYFCRSKLTERVLVIDDVMTTGATLEAIADVLVKGGACSVDVAAVARAYPPNAPPNASANDAPAIVSANALAKVNSILSDS